MVSEVLKYSKRSRFSYVLPRTVPRTLPHQTESPEVAISLSLSPSARARDARFSVVRTATRIPVALRAHARKNRQRVGAQFAGETAKLTCTTEVSDSPSKGIQGFPGSLAYLKPDRVASLRERAQLALCILK